MASVDHAAQVQAEGGDRRVVVRGVVVAVQDLRALCGERAAQPPERARIGAVALAACDHADAAGREFGRQGPGLEQADDLAIVSGRRLRRGEVDDDPFQPTPIEILDRVRDPHCSLDTVTRNLPLAVSGMSSTRCRSRLASLPSTLVISRRT